MWSAGSERADGLRTALVVDRRVRHLETQLYVNRRRRAFLARIFGLDYNDDEESTTHGRRARSAHLHAGNEYLDERCRLRMLHAPLDQSLPVPSSPTLDESQTAAPQHPLNGDQTPTLTPAAST